MTTTVTEKTQLRVMKCASCGGPLVRSKSYSSAGNFLSWQKPWTSWLKMSEPLWMWACMDCGKITFFLKESEHVLAEFKAEVAKGTIEIEWVEHSDSGGQTQEKSKDKQRGGFQRIK